MESSFFIKTIEVHLPYSDRQGFEVFLQSNLVDGKNATDDGPACRASVDLEIIPSFDDPYSQRSVSEQ